ncbi:MAG: dihydroorotate dehydrogenase electron transfer subunit [Oscillospiraceae bacterium]|nr:dihydroorotate dehydrogenase electron transfer subunit [Oscillospiraceae bacterium]
MKRSYNCELIYKKEIADGIFDFRINAPDIASSAQCGQFLHIKCGEGTLLRRPVSICDTSDNTVRFIFEVRGKGTGELAAFKEGDFTDVLGPLGHGFTTDNGKYKNPVVIGGGIGVFPLFKLVKSLNDPTVFLGFRNKSRVVMSDEFAEYSKNVTIATDDGSFGYSGFAVELLREHIKTSPADIIYACGPMPMLRAVKAIAEEADILCEISLEQRMGCGIGACLVCSCETNRDGTDRYARVCKNGPVFLSTEVTLND